MWRSFAMALKLIESNTVVCTPSGFSVTRLAIPELAAYAYAL